MAWRVLWVDVRYDGRGGTGPGSRSMSAPRPRKPRDIDTFRERRAFQRDDRAYRKWAYGLEHKPAFVVGFVGLEVI